MKEEKRWVERGQGRAHSAMLVGRKERKGGNERKRKRTVGHVGESASGRE